MNATTMASAPHRLPTSIYRAGKKYGVLVAIVGLHLAVFYIFRTGLMHEVAQALPREIFVHFITEEPAPEPAPQPRPKPAEPKTVPIIKKTPVQPKPRPVVREKPSPQAVTEPLPPTPALPASPEPPAEAAAPDPEPAPAAPSAPATPRLISGVSYINAPRPVYPPMDARMGNEGTVTLRVLINAEGRAETIEIQKTSGSSRLDNAAREAVKRALFKPYIEDGRPTSAYAIVPINFTLNR